MSELGRSAAVIEADLMKDPETAAIASELGLSVEEYVTMVMDYAKNPDKDPQMEVIPDEIIMQMDPDERPATMAEVQAWMRKVDSGEIDLSPHEFKTGFGAGETKEQKEAMSMSGGKRQLNVPDGPSKEEPKDEAARALRDQLRSQLDSARTVKKRRVNKPEE